MRGLRAAASLLAVGACQAPSDDMTRPRLEIAVTYPAALEAGPLDGRLLVILARRADSEPRTQVEDSPKCAQVFGIDVEGWRPGEVAVVDGGVFGYPLPSLGDVPPGDYLLQALLHRYETFHRADGHVVKLPMDRGEGQQWSKAPGNLLSAPRLVFVEPGQAGRIEVVLDAEIPPIEPPKDTRYVKHVKIRSEKLSRFWGRPMELGAVVLLPHGFEADKDARYPLLLIHGHFSPTIEEIRETPPDPNLVPDYSERFRLHGYNRIQQEQAWELYQLWTSAHFPRYVVMEVQHANPYYDDSYAVNSASLGPYGDAIMEELLPFVEQRFRCIGEGRARFTCGGSTGGWEALAAQVFWPDEFNGCFVACPDPVDFRAYGCVDVYQDENAYWAQGDFARVPRAAKRDWRGQVTSTLEQANHLELVLGTKGRSGGQWDIWQAVFGPVGDDGYPRPIWDKRTGRIDSAVADYWRERYDLRHILARDWATLGPKLRGKIHVYCGTLDNYYLEGAVRFLEEFLRSTKDPPFDGVVDYGPGAEHCWNGDHTRPNALSRLRYAVMYADKMFARMRLP